MEVPGLTDNWHPIRILAECGPAWERGGLYLEPLLSQETLDAIWREAGEAMTDRYLDNQEYCAEMYGPQARKEHVARAGKQRKTALYLIRVGEMYKIGITQTPDSRVKQIQTGSHLEVELLETIWFDSRELALWAEKLLHEKLSTHRVRGEWFDMPCPSLERLVEELGEYG